MKNIKAFYLKIVLSKYYQTEAVWLLHALTNASDDDAMTALKIIIVVFNVWHVCLHACTKCTYLMQDIILILDQNYMHYTTTSRKTLRHRNI